MNDKGPRIDPCGKINKFPPKVFITHLPLCFAFCLLSKYKSDL